MTLYELEKEGEESLSGAMVSDSFYDARALLLYTLSTNMSDLLLRLRDEADNDVIALYEELIKKRCERIPLQHIIGETEFMGLPFYVNENVLCPRPDTEVLIENILKYIKGRGFSKEFRVLDLCTGSGCIVICILKLADVRCLDNFDEKLPKNRICGVGTDLYEEALVIAQKNAWRNKVELDRLDFYQGDLFDALPDDIGLFDIVVSNPPYIPSGYISSLMPEVRDHEPHSALDGGVDGLDFYYKISDMARKFLKSDGRLFFEIGYDQKDDVTRIMKDFGYSDLGYDKDLSGNDRVVWGSLTKRR
ncbi:MAG: peptide chain release factor N(5)-glutamine methyltransferase [Lachnospiraceae bacterium]|nr:peptide chain release factor N(5)-glutamine methyltransferase [Lachnospiraceae bacterium]